MIKFFRHLRKSLIEQNKMGKYLKYAIGEIILVMIGILLALQVNNWNQNRLNKKIETETLSNLKQDLDSALVQLDVKIEQNNLYRTYDSLALEILHNRILVPKDSILKLLLTHIYTPTFDPELGALNEILNTGKMEIIKRQELRNHISSWNRYMDELDEVDKRLIYLDDNVKTPLYFKYLPYRNAFSKAYSPNNSGSVLNQSFEPSFFKIDIETLFYNLEFENLLSNYLIYGQIQRERLLDIKIKMSEMMSLIKKDLNR